MADAEIVIGVRGETAGGKVVKRNLDDIAQSGEAAQKSAKQLEKQFNSLNSVSNSLSNVLRGLIAAFGIRELQRIVDSYTNVQNRLKLVTENASQLTGVTRELFNIANSTRQAFDSTAEVYARTALATKELGLSQRDTLEFTKSLNQAVILSGASAAESSAGLIQLSQGLASGALRGDELRSVLEQLPAVADVIAKGLGVTRGQLRKMGEEGKITADVILESFQKARGELNDKFAKTVPTISQAFTVLRNNIEDFVGSLDTANGVSGKVASAILFLGQNIDTLTKLLFVGASAWLSYKAAVLAASLPINILSLTLLLGPVGLVAALSAVAATIGGTVAAFYLFRDTIDKAVVEPLAKAIVAIDAFIKSYTSFNGLFKGISPLNAIGLTAEDITGGAQDIKNGIGLPNLNAGTVSSVTGQNLSASNSAASKALEDAAKAQKELKDLIAETSTEQERLLSKIAELEKLKGFAKTDQEVQAIDRALEAANKQLETASTAIPGVDESLSRLVSQTDRFADSVTDAFQGLINGTLSAREALSSLLLDLQKFFLKQAIGDPLSNLLKGLFTGGGGGGGIGSILSGGIGKLFGFASGGSMILGGEPGVDQNVLSLNGKPIAGVGRGEVLSISPNQKGGGSGGVTVQQIFNISTGVAETVRSELLAILPQVQKSTIAAVKDANLRGIS